LFWTSFQTHLHLKKITRALYALGSVQARAARFQILEMLARYLAEVEAKSSAASWAADCSDRDCSNPSKVLVGRELSMFAHEVLSGESPGYAQAAAPSPNAADSQPMAPRARTDGDLAKRIDPVSTYSPTNAAAVPATNLGQGKEVLPVQVAATATDATPTHAERVAIVKSNFGQKGSPPFTEFYKPLGLSHSEFAGWTRGDNKCGRDKSKRVDEAADKLFQH
jgi:hypothetical protein